MYKLQLADRCYDTEDEAILALETIEDNTALKLEIVEYVPPKD